MNNQEIERKWLVRFNGNVDGMIRYFTDRGAVRCEIEQHYLDQDSCGELRIRRSSSSEPSVESICTITHKSKGDLVRSETEQVLEREIYEALLWIAKRNSAGRILKDRYTLPNPPQGAKEFVLDVYHGVLYGLAVIEVEFESEEAAAAFALPPEFAESVNITERKEFKNANLSKATSIPTL